MQIETDALIAAGVGPIVNDPMAHAKRRVPELAAEHGRPAAREGEAPPRRPSAKAAERLGGPETTPDRDPKRRAAPTAGLDNAPPVPTG